MTANWIKFFNLIETKIWGLTTSKSLYSILFHEYFFTINNFPQTALPSISPLHLSSTKAIPESTINRRELVHRFPETWMSCFVGDSCHCPWGRGRARNENEKFVALWTSRQHDNSFTSSFLSLPHSLPTTTNSCEWKKQNRIHNFALQWGLARSFSPTITVWNFLFVLFCCCFNTIHSVSTKAFWFPAKNMFTGTMP